ncbi:MAG: hypothetical protein HQ525_08740 [Anaerolineae bacterium]|nr:hypothetical protein [Anaerolineae bacterium]
MTIFVQISVNIPAISGVFDYHLPPELEGKIGIGNLVTIPFNNQIVQGVILRFLDKPSVADTKSVVDLLDPLPVLTPAQIALAERMAEQTLNPLAAMVGLILPSGLSQQADTEFGNRDWEMGVGESPIEFSEIQKRLLSLLQKRGPLRGRQIDRHFKHVDWRQSAQALVRRGILSSKSVLPAPKVRPKFIRTAQLAVPPDFC